MLRPYVSVIRDSFRAAMKSRVLYVVLALIVLVLLVIAPFHCRQTLDWYVTPNSITAPERLAARLVEEGKSGKRPAVEHIWNQLSGKLQTELSEQFSADDDTDESRPSEAKSENKKRGSGDRRPNQVMLKLVAEFNEMMSGDSLYDEQAFSTKRLNEEARGLVDKGSSRSLEEDQRLNRLLLTTALRRDIVAPGQTQLDFYYLVWKWSAFTTNKSHTAFASKISNELPGYFDKFIMSIGIFIAILITASIVPEMLEPGSLNLLLSKPVHRWGLLLAKYIGGCVFILLCATLLFVGLWLWMGIQLGVWERAILLSIPIYVFVFAMYYAISVLAGIWFRSPILCITFAVLFWAVCSVIGYAYAWLDYRHYNTAPVRIAAVHDSVAAVNLLQQTRVWDQDENEWSNPSKRDTEDEIPFEFISFMDRLDELPSMPGPVVDARNSRVVFVDGGIEEAISNSRLAISSTNPDDAWKLASRGRLPNGTIQILQSNNLGQLAIDRSGSVSQWTGTEQSTDVTSADKKEESKKKSKLGSSIGGLLNRGNNRVEYKKIDEVDETFSIPNPEAACLDASNDNILFYSEGSLVILESADGKYVLKKQQPLGDHTNSRMTAFVAAGGNQCFVMLGNGRFYHVDTNTLDVVFEYDFSSKAAIRCLAASMDGKFAALTLRSGILWAYDSRNKTVVNTISVDQGDMMACGFDNQNRLWVGDRFKNVVGFDMDGSREVERDSKGGWMTTAYRLAIRPLHRVFPKPGEFYKLVAHLSSTSDARGNRDVDLTKLPHRDDPWSPLRSGVVFTVLILAFTCIIFQRQDF